MTDPVFGGIDLGTRACAIVSCPTDWNGDWARVRSLVCGTPLKRDEYIADQLVKFAVENRIVRAWVESYGYSQNTAAHTLGELGGVVRLELLRAGVEIRTANMSTSRKLLLGKVPRSDAGIAVYTTLRAAGAAFETADEAAAFGCVNLGLSEAGHYSFAQG